jgi:hypothetical protein
MAGRTVRGLIADGPLLRVQYWRFGNVFRQFAAAHGQSVVPTRTVHPEVADSPPSDCKIAKSFAS